MALKLKTAVIEGKVYAEVVDGKPVFHNEEAGTDVPFDVPQMSTKISALNAEAQGHREKKEAAELALRAFDGIEPDAAKKALETVANLESGELLQAGKVDEIKKAAVDATKEQFKQEVGGLRTQLASLTENNKKVTGDYHEEMLSNRFALSPFVANKMSLPPNMAKKVFGEYFKIEEGKPVAYMGGQKVYSVAEAGSVAEFDEALSIIVGKYPNKDHVLKGRGGSGGGGNDPNNPGGGGGGGNEGKMLRADFDKISDPAKKVKLMRDGVSLVDNM